MTNKHSKPLQHQVERCSFLQGKNRTSDTEIISFYNLSVLSFVLLFSGFVFLNGSVYLHSNLVTKFVHLRSPACIKEATQWTLIFSYNLGRKKRKKSTKKQYTRTNLFLNKWKSKKPFVLRISATSHGKRDRGVINCLDSNVNLCYLNFAV